LQSFNEWESDNMGLVPYNFDPEYLVEEIKSSTFLITKTTVQPSSFSVRLQSFFKMLKQQEVCLALAILESMRLTNDIWHRYKDTETDGVMFKNAIVVLLNSKEFHKRQHS